MIHIPFLLAQTTSSAAEFPLSYFIAGIVAGVILTLVARQIYSKM